MFCFQLSVAQKEATHWYFGENAGLDFSSGDPVFDSKGALNTIEGCATISDSDGNLLFYTDGTSVWNQRHFVMPTGHGLHGNSTSTQSAIIVPKPEDDQIYYIFTVDWSGGFNGLNYYTVDMNLDGGLGDVIGVRGLPKKTSLIRSPTSEKITALQVFNDTSFWVISLKEGEFYVFKVDKNGVNTTPVTGNSGFNIAKDQRGYLKVSPDGNKLVSANMSSGTFIYEFNDVTGQITNERELDVEEWLTYGVEFSPLSKKLYLSTGNVTPNEDPQKENLYQFDLDIEDPSSENLNKTRVRLHSYLNQRSALQLGPNGKIYRAIQNQSSLGVINNPEADGTDANYVHGGIILGNKFSEQGLPPFIQTFFSANIQVQGQCLGDETSFSIHSNEPIRSIVWDFGDGSTSSQTNPINTYMATGDYNVTVSITTDDEVNRIEQVVSIFDLPIITTPVLLQQCDDDNDGFTLFNLRQGEDLITQDPSAFTFTYHLSAIDAKENTNPIEDPESFSNALAHSNKVFARVNNELNCSSVAELNLQVSTTAIPEDYMIFHVECDNELIDGDGFNGITTFDFSSATQEILDLFPSDQELTVTYYENINDALALRNEVDSSNFRNENSPFSQKIVVRVDDSINNSCIGLGFHITLNTIIPPGFDLIDHQILCMNDPTVPIQIYVENAQGKYTYNWRDENGVLLDSNTTSILEVTKPGDYFVTAVSENNCEKTEKITIEASSIALIESVDIDDSSEESSITIHVSGQGEYEFALDDINGEYQADNYFEGLTGGAHIIYVKDLKGCGIQAEGVAILNIPKFFTPNGDGINDTWKIEGVFSQPNSKIYIFDKFGKLLKQINAAEDGWDGYYNGRAMPSTDYWYQIQLEDGRVFKGHFSLIRR